MVSLTIVGIVLFMSVFTSGWLDDGTEKSFDCLESNWRGEPKKESCITSVTAPMVCMYRLEPRDDGSLKEKQHCSPWPDQWAKTVKPCAKTYSDKDPTKAVYWYYCQTDLCNVRNPCTTWTDKHGNTGPWPDLHGGRGGSAGGDGIPPSGQSGIDRGNGGPPSGQDGGAGGGAGPPGAATPPKNGVEGFKSLKGVFSALVIKALVFLC